MLDKRCCCTCGEPIADKPHTRAGVGIRHSACASMQKYNDARKSHQTLVFNTGSKKYRLRNGIIANVDTCETVNGTPRYYGTIPLERTEDGKVHHALVWFADGTCASGDAFDLCEAVGWREPRDEKH